MTTTPAAPAAGTHTHVSDTQARSDARRLAGGTPHVTVVVPTILARVEEVTCCLRSILAQEYPAFDVLVVDNRPTGAPDAGPLLPGNTRLAVLREPRAGISAARNHGLAHATGEIVAFTDDDVVADPGWLAALAIRFTDQPELDVVTGLIEAPEPQTDARRWFEDFHGGVGSARTYEPLTYRVERTPSGRRRALVAELDHRGRPLRLRRAVHGYGIGFTAMLTALVARDPRLLAGLLGQLPLALRARLRELAEPFARPAGTSSAASDAAEPGARHAGDPRRLVWLEAMGWLVGPLAFVRSAVRRC
jgi:hypothetical protein